MPRPGDWPPQVVQGQLIVVPPPCLHELAVADPPIPRVFVFSAVRDQWSAWLARDPPAQRQSMPASNFYVVKRGRRDGVFSAGVMRSPAWLACRGRDAEASIRLGG